MDAMSPASNPPADELLVARSLAGDRSAFGAIVARYGDIFAEVRGDGMMLGLRARVPAADVLAALRARGLLTVSAGDNVVRIYAPLTIEDSQVAEGMALIAQACEDLRRSGAKPA